MAILRKWLLFVGNDNIISNNEDNETIVFDDQPRILYVDEIPLQKFNAEIDRLSQVSTHMLY